MGFEPFKNWEEESAYWKSLSEDNWDAVVKHCEKRSPKVRLSKNEKIFQKFADRPVEPVKVNKPIDFSEF